MYGYTVIGWQAGRKGDVVKTILADQALVDGQWATRVRVDVGDDGRIAAVVPEAARDRHAEAEANAVHRVGCLVPAPANAHSHAFQRAMAGLTEARGPDPRDSFWTWRERMYQFLQRLFDMFWQLFFV